MNALLVYPQCPTDTFWSFRQVLSYVRKKASLPPLGLLTVAAMLPREWNIRLVDMNVNELKEDDIKWADLIMVSAMIVQKESAEKVLAWAKKLGKKTVVGGPYYTTCDRNSIKDADHILVGEVEDTIHLFLSDLAKGEAKSLYVPAEKPNLGHSPVPRWDLINFKDYYTMAVQSNRGCPFGCEFCDVWQWLGKMPRYKSPWQIQTELEALYDAGWRAGVFIVDDNLIGNVRLAKEMLKEIVNWQRQHGYPFTLLTQVSINLAADKELLELMRNANFVKVFIGIETPDPDNLAECGKKQNLRVDLLGAVKKIQEYGMEVMAGFILGFDNDSVQKFDRLVNFVEEAGIPVAMIGLLTALRGTELWKRLVKEQRIVGDSTGNNVEGATNIIPKMGREQLVQGYKRVLSRIYSGQSYYNRVRELLREIRPARKERLKMDDVVAFVQSIVRIGVFSRARFQYWRLLAENFAKPTFSLAVQFAIIGQHFMKVSRNVVLKT